MAKKEYLYLEIAASLQSSIFKYGTAGEQLKSIHKCAEIYNTTTATISNAFHFLEKRGIIEHHTYKGFYVCEDILEKRDQYIQEITKNFLHEMDSIGYSRREVIQMIEMQNE